jgi:hypothetical protein
METATAFVGKVYDHLTYVDLYGGSIAIVLAVTLAVLAAWFYFKALQTSKEIASDWTAQRCKPQNMLFAGQIMRPTDKTAAAYTRENFDYCVQNIVTDFTSFALQPFQYATQTIMGMQEQLGGSVNDTRGIMATLRDNVRDVSETIFQRTLNVMIPLQRMFVALLDTLNKTQGVMTASLYTFFGSYLTLQSLMGAVMEMIIKLLVALTILIVGLWVVPVTWPAASAASAVYLSIAIPLAIIIAFMQEVLHVKTSGIPKLRCFDGDTQCILKTGELRAMRHVQPGDTLWDGAVVTSTVAVTSEMLAMYQVGSLTLSGNHRVFDVKTGAWVRADMLRHAQRISAAYSLEHELVYCLNTTTKMVRFPFLATADWDEIVGNDLRATCRRLGLSSAESLSDRLVDSVPMYDPLDVVHTRTGHVTMLEAEVGMALSSKGNSVYGIVRGIGGVTSLLTTASTFVVNGALVRDYNAEVDAIAS